MLIGICGISGVAESVLGGVGNQSNGGGSAILGGLSNTANDEFSTVGGGQGNSAAGPSSTILGGHDNSLSSSDGCDAIPTVSSPEIPGVPHLHRVITHSKRRAAPAAIKVGDRFDIEPVGRSGHPS